MKNYTVISDKKKLMEFIDWLPNLEINETFYLCLFARNKYCKGITHIKSDKCQLKRFTSNKQRLLQKIQQLECPEGSYMQKDIIVPQEALALYITINPRCFVKATKASLTKLLDLYTQVYNGHHPYQEVISEIQKSCSRKIFTTFDFDIDKSLWPNILDLIHLNVNEDALTVVETRGGYHVLIKHNSVTFEYQKTWYQRIAGILSLHSSDKNNKGDIMLPVPGTYQGGFTPEIK